MQKDSSQHHNSQYEPMEIEIRLRLKAKSMNPQSAFYSLISANGGLTIKPSTIFTVTSRDSDSFRIQISSDNLALLKAAFGGKGHLSFHIISTLSEASTACSKLNMALALSCKLVATLDDKDVVFHLTAPRKNVENVLLRHFNIFEGRDFYSEA